MATNFYFNNFPANQITSEQLLVEDLVIESMQLHGMDVFYLPRTSRDQVDYLYGEDTLKEFRTAYPIEMYLENVTGMDGQGDFISKFGLEIQDEIGLLLSRRRFAASVPLSRAREGDLIFVPLTQSFYEITFVEHENDQAMFYTLGRGRGGNVYVYALKLKQFVFSEEIISTGVSQVDIQAFDAYKRTSLYLANTSIFPSGTGSFIPGEVIYNIDDMDMAYVTAQISNFSLSNIIITNSGSNYYSQPTITVSAPPAARSANLSFPLVDSSVGSATIVDGGYGYISANIVFDAPTTEARTANAGVTLSGSVITPEIDDAGAYYLSNTTATISGTRFIEGYNTELTKWGTVSYKLLSDFDDRTFSQQVNMTDGDMHFYVYVPSSGVTYGRFISVSTEDTSNSTTTWDMTLVDYGTSINLESSLITGFSSTLTEDEWHLITVRKEIISSNTKLTIYVDAVEQANVENTSSELIASVYKNSFSLLNSECVGIYIDDVWVDENAADAITLPTVEPVNGATQDESTIILLNNFESNNSIEFSEVVSATVSGGEVTTVASLGLPSEVVGASVTIGAPTGTANNFTATGTVVISAENRSITDITITYAGKFYLETPTFELEAPTASVTAIVTAGLSSGSITQMFINNAGVNYNTAPTITISLPGLTDSTRPQAIVHSYTPHSKVDVIRLRGDFTTSGNVYGATSGAIRYMTADSVNTDTQVGNSVFEDYSDNVRIETEADSILDFSENNPFGEA